MSKVTIDLPEATLVALKLDAFTAAAELRVAAAMKLYELGRLSSGVAAELAGMSRIAFLVRLSEFVVDAFRQTDAELADDFAHA